MTSTDSSARIVTAFLESRGAKIHRSTQHGEYITASWTIGGWENLLATEFHEFEGPEVIVFRALEYTVPEEIEAHTHGLLNVLEVSESFHPFNGPVHTAVIVPRFPFPKVCLSHPSSLF